MLKKSGYLQIAVYIFLVLTIIALFYRFTSQNSARIKENNRVYAEDAALQTALRIDDQFQSAKDLIKSYAFFLSNSESRPVITPQFLKEMEENSPFDAVRYTDDKGLNHSADGTLTDLRDRQFFRHGMQGRSGISVVFHSRIFGQPVLTFYAPLNYGGKILGVLHGVYLANKYLQDILETTYFGKPADVFLCTADGKIIATSGEAKYSGTILDSLLADGMIDKDTAEKAADAFKKGLDATFACAAGSKTDNLCIIHLPRYNYVLVQTFPRGVTQKMINSANLAGVELEASLLALFALYAAFVLWRARSQKLRLEKENREFGQVIDGMDILFEGQYVLADMEDRSFHYIAENKNAVPAMRLSGTHSYTDYVKWHADSIIEAESQENFRQFFNPERFAQKFMQRDFLVYECHVKREGSEEWENMIAICLARKDGAAQKILFVRQNVTDLKLRELRTQKRLSIMDRKERQYRVAVASNAICTYEFNVSKDIIEDEIYYYVGGKRIALLSLGNMQAPCKASAAFASWLPMVLPESREDYQQVVNPEYMRQKYEAGDKEIEVDYWATTPAGDEICVRQSFYMTLDGMSGDIMAMTVARDITAQVKKQRQATRALQDALMQAQHANAAKTTFLSNMSHDIRTPMNAIIGFATIAASHLDNRDQVRDCLQKVLSSSNHLLSLINDILDMSRIESGNLQIKEQECNISELMHNLVNIIQPQVKAKQMQLFIDTFDVANEDVITDPLKLNQVFINLLSNAVKYTPAGGVVSFRISQTPAFRHDHADYTFEVRDNGIGMSEEFAKHIFEPFTRETTTTRSGIEGTGLGMAITKNIIEMMNGKIELQSAPGKGSVFTVTLTLKLQDKEKANEDIKALQGLRALVVDDDFHICDSVDKMLKKIGLRSEWTTSGREAAYRAKIAHEEKDPYHTFIIDWQMPDMNGVETARRIRKTVGADAPIIILTAYEWADIEEEAREAGVTAFCAKPLFMSDLRNALLTTNKMLEEKEAPVIEKEDFGGKRILLVDDLELNREVAEFILTESGFLVETAPDGTDAVEMVRKSPERYYDAILMDVQMPTMNGYEATRAIRNLDRADTATMPIIAMTANALDEDKAAALKSGMNAHIAKPIDIKSFFEVMKKFLEHKKH